MTKPQRFTPADFDSAAALAAAAGRPVSAAQFRQAASQARTLAGIREWLRTQPRDYSYALAELDRLEQEG